MAETEFSISPDERPIIRPRSASARWATVAAVGALAAIVAGGAYYFWQHQPAPAETPPPSTQVVPAPKASAEPSVEHPIDGSAASSTALPALGESDSAVREALSGLFGAGTFDALFRPGELIRNIVATIDNLPRKSVAVRLSPLKPLPGAFRVSNRAGATVIGVDNGARYAPYVRAMEAVDATKLVALYVRLYPLFQQAYAELGYPQRYFNDRVFEVIDHLLAAPEAPREIALTQPKVLYEYADPNLAELSAGQKLLVRMGPDNEAKVKAKLAEIKRALSKGN